MYILSLCNTPVIIVHNLILYFSYVLYYIIIIPFFYSCTFEGTREELVAHLEQCKFEGLKVD